LGKEKARRAVGGCIWEVVELLQRRRGMTFFFWGVRLINLDVLSKRINLTRGKG